MNNVVNTSHIGYKIRDVLLCGKFTAVVLCVLILLSGARFTGFVDYWLVDLCSHFPVQYGIVSLGVLGICLWKKRFSLGLLAAILSMINLSIFAEYKPISQPPSPDKGTFTVYLANIWRFNPISAKLNQEITRVEADCVLLLEVTPECMKSLQPIIRHFPYRLEQATKGSTGLLFLSRYPIIDYYMSCLAEHGNKPLLSATLQIEHKRITFYGVHPYSPVRRRRFHNRNRQLLWLADRIAKSPEPVIVAGDFNTTPFSPVFQEVLARSGLRDPRIEAGWQPSWPTYMPLFWLPIDHILVSSDIRIHHVSTGTFIWSDHYPVIAELSIKEDSLGKK
jgi:endonuclease/exonuclease/phosphatase (EEP) superfamily protein YafD